MVREISEKLKAMTFDSAIFFTRDLEKAVAFYRDVFGSDHCPVSIELEG